MRVLPRLCHQGKSGPSIGSLPFRLQPTARLLVQPAAASTCHRLRISDALHQERTLCPNLKAAS